MMSWLLPIVILILILILVERPAIKITIRIKIRIRLRPLAFYLITGLLATAGSAKAQVGLRLEAGLGGKVRPGRWAPLRVTATNSGEPVSGQLVLALSGARTTLPLELPSAANQRVEAALIPQSSYQSIGVVLSQASASLREGSAGGREVASVQTPIKLLPDTARLLVVCSGETGGLRFLEGVSLGRAGWSLPLEQQQQLWSGTVEIAPVTPAQMPLDRAGLDAADLLVIRDAAWRQLEPSQRRAVRQWTEWGGRLLLCGEDPAGFQDQEGQHLLPVEPAGAQPRPQLTSLPLPGREPIRAAAGQVMTVRARPRPDALVVLREGSSPLVVSRPAGFGAVLWLGFDPFRVPPRGIEARQALWSFLINHATGSALSEPAFPALTDVPAAADPLRSLPRFPAPSRWTLGAFGLVYVLVFGPLNLWLLRRLRRTVRAWLLMPALSVLLTGAVLALGTAWGQARVVFHTVSVIEAMAGSGTAREQCLAVLFSPTNRRFSLEVDSAAPIVRFLSEGSDQPAPAAQPFYPGGAYVPPSGTAGADQGSPAVMPDVQEGELSRWNQIALTLWKLQSIQADLAVDLGGGVQVDLDDRLTGRVVNGTPVPLQDAYLQFHGWRQRIGDLAPGTACRVSSAGWRRRLGASQPGQAEGETRKPSEFPQGGSRQTPDGSMGNDLLGIAGSLLRASGQQAEVVLVARAPSLAPPIRIPGVARSLAARLPAGAILVVRKPVSPTTGLPSRSTPGGLSGKSGRLSSRRDRMDLAPAFMPGKAAESPPQPRKNGPETVPDFPDAPPGGRAKGNGRARARARARTSIGSEPKPEHYPFAPRTRLAVGSAP